MSRHPAIPAGLGGCSFHALCLTCPFPKCYHDYFERGQSRAELRARVLEMAADGYTPEQIAVATQGFGSLAAEEVRQWLAAAGAGQRSRQRSGRQKRDCWR